MSALAVWLFHLSNPKPGHATGGSGRGAQRGGRVGPGRTGRRQNSTPRRQASLVPPKASKKPCLNVSPEARTSETLCKPNVGTKSAVDDRFIRGLSPGREGLFVPGCRPVDRRLFVFVNPFHARHVREKQITCAWAHQNAPETSYQSQTPAIQNLQGSSFGPVRKRPGVSK